MAAYYNDSDPYCIGWIRNLMKAGLIPDGEVDSRSIRDVQADDVRGFAQCHWFAGIGGGGYACRLAGLPDDAPIWTGGPPCQDNSTAAAIHGKREGLRGERSGLAHTWLDLVGACRPHRVLFENVVGVAPWIAEIVGRLEGLGYRVSRRRGTAAAVGAPHPRRRVWVSAHLDGARLEAPRQAGPSAAVRGAGAAAARDPWDPDQSWGGVLDDGLSARLAGVRSRVVHGFGNAWVPQAAAEILRAMMTTENGG